MIIIDGVLCSESAIRSITQRGAAYVITLVDGEVIVTHDEPFERRVVPVAGLELWSPVDLGDGRIEWGIEPVAAMVLEHYLVGGTVAHAGVLPAGGWSDDSGRTVLVDRGRRLARPMNDSGACWTSDLAAALSAALGREVDDVPDLALIAA